MQQTTIEVGPVILYLREVRHHVGVGNPLIDKRCRHSGFRLAYILGAVKTSDLLRQLMRRAESVQTERGTVD